MRTLIIAGVIDFLNEGHKARLNALLRRAGGRLMPHSLAVAAGLKLDESLALLAFLQSEGLLDNRLLVYHVCDLDMPALTRAFGTGFPALPFECPECEEVVRTYDDLAFDVEGKLLDGVELA